MSDGVRIVFIGGYARTGSTLLDRLLGQIEGFASFGELRHVWDRNFRGNQLCGCGVPFRECPFWREVAGEAFGGMDAVDAVAIGGHKRVVDSFWRIPRNLSGGWTAAYARHLTGYLDALARLYSGIQRASGARFIVDSTKDPQHAYALGMVPGFDVRMVHLVRDSRAVAFSWRRVKLRPEITWQDRPMPRFPIVRSALAWDLANLAAEATGRRGFPYVRVRYEDLVRDPRGTIHTIVDRLDLGPAELGFLEPGGARLGVAHTVAGNPMRFAQGVVPISPDEEWTSTMPAAGRAVVTGLTAPLLAHYGYRVRAPRASAGPTAAEMAHVLRLAFSARRDPVPYTRAVSGLTLRYLRSAGVEPRGRWLDVGSGGGGLSDALRSAGASVTGLDIQDRRLAGLAPGPFVVGRGEGLPFADGSFDGVVSSNVLEHAPDTWGLIDELLRVCRPGGTVYLSWTNWYSPLGGHEWSPFHYLGPRLGIRAYRAVRGRDPAWNIPGRTLFPVHVGPVLRGLRQRPAEVRDIAPRYWPSLRILGRVPVLREVAMWNCVVLLQKPPVPAAAVLAGTAAR